MKAEQCRRAVCSYWDIRRFTRNLVSYDLLERVSARVLSVGSIHYRAKEDSNRL